MSPPRARICSARARWCTSPNLRRRCARGDRTRDGASRSRHPQPLRRRKERDVAEDGVRPLKWQSGGITDGASRAPARAMLHASGFSAADLSRPLVGVANTWIEIGPCNYHLRDLAASVKAGIRAAGGTPMEFNTVSLSDGITMGSAGMRTSLVSREVIAD